ncbi:hypothetical protein P3X46_006267 [Hevea brasiliensis]|uniref:Potassium channel domain-containing protein n=1 Tax=Hevea brasiliensis TaxID=3981 RepID=A0ABQ9MPN1_HEVBR|nr:two-pore potassium channel 1 [Hevea brasiliensis]XP_021637482.2 two-pore potassium channel 1 [Hevea brasiliensis]XP_058001152.1 two-pore potassium channel 1 [Hevea brasiliensis]KAJ9182251.1 hypothetical protein P3X46_006267 [Hevea brasiliensis]KAJ9182252.1 hypothetical protein P3X46_006267 [Hevea brasiliensis]
MASNGANQPLNPTPQTNNAFASNRRNFLNIKSAPLAKFVSSEFGGKPPSAESIFGKLHSSFREVAVILAFYLGVGTLCFYFAIGDLKGKKTSPILDALYFCVVTMTTVGYGDLKPNTSFAKILVFVFVFTGMALVALIMKKVADYLVEKQEIMLVKALNKQQENDPSKITEETEFNRPMFKCLLAMAILSVLMIIGAIFLFVVEGLDAIDSLFCVITTVTTLGFENESFSTKGGRAFGIFWILSTTLGLGQFFLYAAEVFIESRQKALVNWIHTWRMTTNHDLETVNIDNDGVVGDRSAESIISKLKEMGKISQEDLSLALNS